MKKLKILILMFCIFVPFAFSGCENKNKEILSTPNILEIRGGTIVFNQIDDAEYYTLSINDHTLTLHTKTNNNIELIDNKIHFDASNIFIVGNSYSVKVKANAKDKYNSNYSAVYSYKHNGNIKKPENLKINGNTLTWDVVENASYYIVKVITPANSIIFDKEGNILENDDSETIAQADLTEYTFNTNQFDFSSLLSSAGIYKFYVNAVLSAGANYVESGYSSKINHTQLITLAQPTNGIIKRVGASLHLSSVIDPNANAISIECNGIEKTLELNNSSLAIAAINDNYLDINLSRFFETVEEVDLTQIAQYSFRIQAKHISSNPENAFYLNSTYSDYAYYESQLTLSAPFLTLTQDLKNDCYLASWTCLDSSLISEYKLIICLADEVKEFKLDSNISSKLIYEDFVAIAVKAIGVGNYKSSNFSNFVSHPDLANNLQDINPRLNQSSLIWSDYADYYVVEFDNDYWITDDNSFQIESDKISDNDYSISITAIKDEFKNFSKEIKLTYSSQLETPTFRYGQGFSSANLYELTFTGSQNAIGYYVYLKAKNASNFEKIDNLYLDTTIDLSKYICSEGNFTDYEVKVQAVADLNGLYTDSELSTSVTVSHIQVLEKPSFYKINNAITPVSKTILGNSTKYTLKFNGVLQADSYEILINYNKIEIKANNSYYTGVYEVDISNYLIAANNYEIKIRAIPSSSSVNIKASEYNIANYALTKQLPMVNNIKISENDGIYTLSFDPVNNADAYRVRVMKDNDSNYSSYLNSLGLSNTFVTKQSIDVSQYVTERGSYYFYVTALAPTQNSYYSNSTESSTFGYVSKLTTLNAPSNATYFSESKTFFTLGWIGDDNADYYLVKITDPRNITNEFKVYGETSTDINQYINVQGQYYISIYSMINPLGENAKEYTSSAAYNANFNYTYSKIADFERYSIYMFGSSYDFLIENVQDLKNILWYHYLYGVNPNTNLSIMLKQLQKEDGTTEEIRESIIRLATEANDALLHPFAEDEGWLALIGQTSSDNQLFSYLSKTLLNIYPEFNILESFNLLPSNKNEIFNLYFENALNKEKIESKTKTLFNKNYGNDYKYIDLYSRKSETGIFNIDSREEYLVTTTEQLMQAVQHNKKPRFIGESQTAATVYNNAKLVLSAIVSNNMTDLEKVNAIFNWLSASFDLAYYSESDVQILTGSVEKGNLAKYGLNKIYYLEGIFEDISMLSNGDIKVGNNLATSWSYSKAFALLCAIEGIDSVVVNGSYSYYNMTQGTDALVQHAWNKVYINTSVEGTTKNWYSIDLTFSDNRIYFNNLTKGYGMSSHSHFLTTDSFAQLNLNVNDNNHLISKNYQNSRICNTTYDYYLNTSFALSYDEIDEAISGFENMTTKVSNFEYSLKYNPKTNYQQYSKTTGYGKLQSFLLNTLIYAKHKADKNTHNRSMFEFKFNFTDNNNSSVFDISQLQGIFETAPTDYNLKLKLIMDANNSIYSIVDSENKATTVIFIVEKTA